MMQGKKKCSKCGEIKSLVCFDTDKIIKSGYRSQCKECRKAYAKDNNKDYIKKYHAEHRQEINAQQRERYKNKTLENKELLIRYKTLKKRIEELETENANLSFELAEYQDDI